MNVKLPEASNVNQFNLCKDKVVKGFYRLVHLFYNGDPFSFRGEEAVYLHVLKLEYDRYLPALTYGRQAIRWFGISESLFALSAFKRRRTT